MRISFLDEVLNKGAKTVAEFLIKQKREGKLKNVKLEEANSTVIVGGAILAGAAAVGAVGMLAGTDDEENERLEEIELRSNLNAKEVADLEMNRVEKEHRKKELKLAMYMDAFNTVGDDLKKLNDKNGATDDLVNEWTADFERVRKHKEELKRHDEYIEDAGSYKEVMASRRNQMDIMDKETSDLASDIAEYIETGVEQYTEKEYVK